MFSYCVLGVSWGDYLGGLGLERETNINNIVVFIKFTI